MKFNKKALSVLLAAVILSLTLTGLAAPRANAEDGKWIATWSTSLVDASITISNVSFQDLVPSNSTLRTEIVVTTAGTKLQFVFSNRFGAQPFTINAASLARTEGQYQAKIQDGTQTPITFNNGATAVTIPAGGNVKSDVIDFSTRAMDKLSISLFIENLSYIQTAGLSNGRCYMNAGGFLFGKSKINDPELPNASEISLGSSTITYHTIPLLEEVDSFSPDVNASCAVFIGDSTLVNDTYLNYAKRIASTGTQNISVINKAIIGNKLLSDGSGIIGKLYGHALIDRFQRDVLDVAGVKYCFVKIGLNDVLHQFSKSLSAATPAYTPDQIIGGYRTLIRMAHEHGIKIYFFTKSAWKGYQRAFLGQTDDLSWNQDAQNMCDELTKWTLNSNEADGKIDCAPLADPSDTTKLCSTFTPDGAHLTELGAIAMADLIPLEYVGLSSSAGKTAAALAGVDPYVEKAQIIKRMNTPTTTQTPATTARQQTPASTPAKPAAPATPSVSTSIVYVPAPGDFETAYEYIAPATNSTPSTYPYAEQNTQAEPVYNPDGANTPGNQDVNYNVQDATSDVTSIGSGVPIGFILALLFVIIIVAAVVILTVGKKQEEY